MKLPDIFENIGYQSAKAGDIARQLALVGIALVWFFRVERGGVSELPLELTLAALLFVVGLAADFLQYVVAYRKWDQFAKTKERELMELEEKGELESESLLDADFTAPDDINKHTEMFLWVKLISITAGYLPLLWFLFFHVRTE